MAKSRNTRNRTNPNTETPSLRKQRREARADGRGANAAYTSGARTAQEFKNARGYRISDLEGMRQAWNDRQNVQTYTRSRNGQMSVNGRTAGGTTWTYTNRDMDGNFVRQSGRSQVATRRQRDYDTRSGMNNISAKTVERWKQLGWVREVDGNLQGDGRNVRGITIHQKEDGNYSMGLSVG